MEKQKLFKVDDRVRFDLDGTAMYKGTGTVLGLSSDQGELLRMYIVLLDKPILGQKGVCVPSSLMELED